MDEKRNEKIRRIRLIFLVLFNAFLIYFAFDFFKMGDHYNVFLVCLLAFFVDISAFLKLRYQSFLILLLQIVLFGLFCTTGRLDHLSLAVALPLILFFFLGLLVLGEFKELDELKKLRNHGGPLSE